MLDINISHDCFDLHQRSKVIVKECDSRSTFWMDCDHDGAQCYLSWGNAAPQNICWRICLRPFRWSALPYHWSIVVLLFLAFDLNRVVRRRESRSFSPCFYCISWQPWYLKPGILLLWNKSLMRRN